MLLEAEEGRDQRTGEWLDAQVQSEFFTQLQELRERIRQWEAENGDGGSRNLPS